MKPQGATNMNEADGLGYWPRFNPYEYDEDERELDPSEDDGGYTGDEE